ncbi:MAG TPA: sialidase family protein [Ktedonobacterales bacterium]
MRTRLRIALGTVALIGLAAAIVVLSTARTATASPSLTFTTAPLLLTDGSSEPEISIGSNGTMGIVSLQWLFDPAEFGTQLWTGPFGSTPTLRGVVDSALQHPGKTIFGAGDADVDIGSTGRLHITTLIFLQNPTGKKSQLGVSAISCPSPTASGFSISQCSAQIIDTAGADRSWVSSDGQHVYISYHDAGNSSLIHVQRSDDDGATFKQVADPVVGQDGTTADATFNNIQGKLVADPHTHNVYDIYAAGETGVLKGRTFTPNHIIVSRSSDMGQSWTATTAFTAPAGTSLGNIFPALAVDPTNGNLYAVWSDGKTVSLASSTDQGNHWSSAVTVSGAPATTAVLPWVAAYHGTVDVVYYGTTASSDLDPSADWHVYFAQSTGGGFTQAQVNSSPNHHGVICTGGTGCGPGTRNLLDLFQVAIDPQNGKAAIIYTDDTLSTSNDPNNFACLPSQTPPCPLPQAVLAQQS